MTTIRAYTTIEQSKKLAEILPLESADMLFQLGEDKYADSIRVPLTKEHWEQMMPDIKPCWSLAALLNILDYPQLSKDKLGSGKTGWMVSVYPDDCRYDSCWHDNPIDACYELILKLNELKML